MNTGRKRETRHGQARDGLTGPKTLEANECANILTGVICETMLDDHLWRLFGFRRRPRRGLIWDIFWPSDRLRVERFLSRELAVLALAVTVRTVKACLPYEWRVPVLAGILDRLIAEAGMRRAFGFGSLQEAAEYFRVGAKAYLSNPADWSNVFAKRRPHVQEFVWYSRLIGGALLLLETCHPVWMQVAQWGKGATEGCNLVGKVCLSPDSSNMLVGAVMDLMDTLERQGNHSPHPGAGAPP